MNRKLTIAVLVGFVGAILVVTALVALSKAVKNNQGSFLREYPPHPVEEGDTLGLHYHSYYIAGGTPHTLYLGNSNAPFHVLEVNLAKLDTHHVHLDIRGAMEQKFWSPRVMIDSPNFYLVDGAVPVLFKGSVTTWNGERYPLDSSYFLNIVRLHAGSFAVRSLSGKTGENILGKLTEWPPRHQFTDAILQKQLDGIFCTEGVLRYNQELNQLVYIYKYRNEFMVMDTSLRLVYRGHTIDTTTKAKIATGRVETGGYNTLASPPFRVNDQMDASGRWLFVNSALVARNEHPAALKRGYAIDLYDQSTGKYAYSFYIYRLYGTKAMNEFRVLGDHLIVRYDNVIQKFRLKPEYFKTYGLSGNDIP